MNIKKLDDLMQKEGITIAGLEKALNLGNGTIRKWKTQPTNPQIDTLQKVATYFGVDVGYLVQ